MRTLTPRDTLHTDTSMWTVPAQAAGFGRSMLALDNLPFAEHVPGLFCHLDSQRARTVGICGTVIIVVPCVELTKQIL